MTHYERNPARPDYAEPPNPGAGLVTAAIVIISAALLSCSLVMLAVWIVVSRGWV